MRLMSGPAAARHVGVTYRDLDYWCRSGLLGEQPARSLGSGNARQFGDREIRMLRFIDVARHAAARKLMVLKEPAALAATAGPGDTLIWCVGRDIGGLYTSGEQARLIGDLAALIESGYSGAVIVWRSP